MFKSSIRMHGREKKQEKKKRLDWSISSATNLFVCCLTQAQTAAMGEERGRRQQRLMAAEREEAQLFAAVLAAAGR